MPKILYRPMANQGAPTPPTPPVVSNSIQISPSNYMDGEVVSATLINVSLPSEFVSVTLAQRSRETLQDSIRIEFSANDYPGSTPFAFNTAFESIETLCYVLTFDTGTPDSVVIELSII